MDSWAVTLTGGLQPDVDDGLAWQRVAEALHQPQAAFDERIGKRLPVTLPAAADHDQAQRQQQALERCGVEALALPDDGARLWVRLGDASRGPVSAGYARQMLAQGSWVPETLVCPRGSQDWQRLDEAMAQAASTEDQPPPDPVPAPAAVSSGARAAARDLGPLGAPLPTEAERPGLHGGFWLRFVAYFIDSLIISIPLFVLTVVMGIVTAASADNGTMGGMLATWGFMLAGVVIMWLYMALCEASRWRATPGKLALGLRVVDMHGGRIGFGRASGRFAGRLLSKMSLYIGYMLAGWTGRKQALHDMLAGCCVVREHELQALRRGDAASNQPSGMPGWAIALLVAAVLFLVVVPVVAILAAIAIPAYQSYVVRAQVAEGLALAQPAKGAVTRYLADYGRVPDNNQVAGLPTAAVAGGRYVADIQIEQGAVVVTYGGAAVDAELRGSHVVLTPSINVDGSVTWSCSSPDIKDLVLPVNCR